MADLVSGRFPQSNLYSQIFGNNTVNSSYPARTNMEYQGLNTYVDGAIAATGVGIWVPVYVDPGEVITSVNWLSGQTAASLPTHQGGGLYSGLSTPALLAKSADGASLPSLAASVAVSYALTSPYQVKAADVPNGYLWAGFTITATTIPTAICFTSTTAPMIAFTGTAPTNWSSTSGSSLAGVPAATLTLAAKE